MYKTAAMTCLALFMTAVLEKFFHGKPDYRTLRLLGVGNESGSIILKIGMIPGKGLHIFKMPLI